MLELYSFIDYFLSLMGALSDKKDRKTRPFILKTILSNKVDGVNLQELDMNRFTYQEARKALDSMTLADEDKRPIIHNSLPLAYVYIASSEDRTKKSIIVYMLKTEEGRFALLLKRGKEGKIMVYAEKDSKSFATVFHSLINGVNAALKA